MRSHIHWPDDAPIIFFWSQHVAAVSPWGIFLRNWRAFLLIDEYPILVRPAHPEFIQFSSSGSMGIGSRRV